MLLVRIQSSLFNFYTRLAAKTSFFYSGGLKFYKFPNLQAIESSKLYLKHSRSFDWRFCRIPLPNPPL